MLTYIPIQRNLVGLKFITHSQIVEVSYEGLPRRFSIDSISARLAPGTGDLVSSVTEEVKSLSIHSQPHLWTAGWDTYVCILENNTDRQVGYPHKVSCDGTSLTRGLSNDAYTCVVISARYRDP